MNTRLSTIVVRQRQSRIRDLFFAAVILVAGAVSASSVQTALQAAHVAQR